MSNGRDDWDRFVERKMRQAVDAALPPYETELDAPDPSFTALGNSWSEALFDGPFYITSRVSDDRPASSLVFVQSADGNTVADDPSSLGGGNTDQHLIYEGLSRVAADAVLAGAATVRTGRVVFSVWHPQLIALRQSLNLPRHPVQIVGTLSGLDLDRGFLFNVPEVPVVLIASPTAAAAMAGGLTRRPWIRVIETEPAGDLTHAFRSLRGLHVTRVSCVGGRSLAGALLDRGLVDDIYLTTAPRPGGAPHTPMYGRPLDASLVLRKRGSGDESGVRFEHRSLR
jgi:riboflavin biosynthesis pyrimidine reductase